MSSVSGNDLLVEAPGHAQVMYSNWTRQRSSSLGGLSRFLQCFPGGYTTLLQNIRLTLDKSSKIHQLLLISGMENCSSRQTTTDLVSSAFPPTFTVSIHFKNVWLNAHRPDSKMLELSDFVPSSPPRGHTTEQTWSRGMTFQTR